MNVRKLIALGVSAVVLGAQLWAIIPPGKSWYWPFMDYPMYSRSHSPGDIFATHQLRAVPCDTAVQAFPVTHKDLHFGRFHFFSALRYVAGPTTADPRTESAVTPATSDSMANLLSGLLKNHLDMQVCGAQVRERVIVLGRDVSRQLNAPWQLLREWPLDKRASHGPGAESEAGPW